MYSEDVESDLSRKELMIKEQMEMNYDDNTSDDIEIKSIRTKKTKMKPVIYYNKAPRRAANPDAHPNFVLREYDIEGNLFH